MHTTIGGEVHPLCPSLCTCVFSRASGSNGSNGRVPHYHHYFIVLVDSCGGGNKADMKSGACVCG